MVSAGDETAERGAWRPAWWSYLNNVTSRSRWTKIDDDVSDKTSAGDGVDEQTGQQTTTLYRNADGHPLAPFCIQKLFSGSRRPVASRRSIDPCRRRRYIRTNERIWLNSDSDSDSDSDWAVWYLHCTLISANRSKIPHSKECVKKIKPMLSVNCARIHMNAQECARAMPRHDIHIDSKVLNSLIQRKATSEKTGWKKRPP